MNRVLQVVLTGNASNLRGVLAQSAAEVKAYSRTVEQANDSVAASAVRASTGVKALATGAGVLAVALGYGVVKAAQFESSMRNVNSLARLSEEGLATLSEQVIAMSTRLPQSANTLAEGLYDVIGSGFEAADAMTVLNAAATAASAGLTTTEVAARAIGGVLNAYGLEASDAADVSDVLFQTVNLGVLSFDELAGSIGDTVGTAAAAKVGIDQVGSAIATMTLTGISGAESATSLNNLLQSMIKPSEALADKFSELGYTSGAQALEADGLRVVMDKLRVSTHGNVTELLELFPNIRGARGALALMSNEGKNYARVSEELEDKNKRHGATQKVLEEQLKATSNQWTLFKNGLDAGAITVGTKVLPLLIGLMKGLQQVGGFASDTASDIAHRLEPAWDLLAQTGENVWKVLEAIYEIGSPIVGVLLKVGGAAVIGAIMALMKVLEMASGFLADNQELAIALGIVMAVQLAGGVGAAQVAFWRLIGTPVVLFLSSVLGGAGAVATFLTGGFSAAAATARAALMKLLTAAAPLAALAAIVYVGQRILEVGSIAADTQQYINDMFKPLEKAKTNADRVNALTDAIDGLKTKVAETRAELNNDDFWDWAAKTSEWGQIPGLDTGPSISTQLTDDTDEQTASLKRLEESLDKAREAKGRMSEATAILADQFNTSKDRVIELADKYGIDLTGAVSDSVRLFQNFQSMDAGDQKKAKVQELIDAMGVLADETSTAAERVDALKTALDLLGGKEISVFQASSSLAESVAKATGALAGLKGQVLSAEGGLYSGSEAGRVFGGIMSDIKTKGDDLITTMVEQGSTFEEVQQANNDLRASFIKAAGEMGITGTAADILADKVLGTTGDRELRIKATISDAAAKIEAIRLQLAGLQDKDVAVRISAVTDRSVANAQYLLNKEKQFGFRGGITGMATAPPWTRLEKYDTGGVRNEFGPVQWTPGGPMPTVPMIAMEHPGGGLINWAEPGTGGEALIPMGMQNREKSKRLVEYLAQEFGMKSFATGGVLAPASSPSYQPTGSGGYGPGYSLPEVPVVEVNARIFVGDREITDLVDSRVEVKFKDTVRTARAAGRGRS